MLQIKACFTFLLIVQNGNQESFSIKCQRINILGFVGHIVSVATTQIYPSIAKAAKDSQMTSVAVFNTKTGGG